MIKRVIISSILLAISLVSYAQCAMCRATVENNLKNGEGTVGKGLNTGILYLMSIPYVLLTIIAGIFIYNYRKNKKKHDKQLGN